MHVEVSVALNFVISYLYNKLPRRRVNMFAEELEKGIKMKFAGHWYFEKPTKGSAYRSIRVNGENIDPVMVSSAYNSGLNVEEVKEYLPEELTLWIDPMEVSYQIGEKGPVKVLYSNKKEESEFTESELQIATRGFNPDAECFRPIDAMMSSSLSSLSLSPSSPTPSSNWSTGTSLSPSSAPNGSGSTNSVNNVTNALSFQQKHYTHFTTATFAQTKFGSTKLKTQAKRPTRLSPTEFGNYLRQKNAAQHQQIPNGFHSPQSPAQNNFNSPQSPAQNGFNSPHAVHHSGFYSPQTAPHSGFQSPQSPARPRSLSLVAHDAAPRSTAPADQSQRILFSQLHQQKNDQQSKRQLMPTDLLSPYAGSVSMLSAFYKAPYQKTKVHQHHQLSPDASSLGLDELLSLNQVSDNNSFYSDIRASLAFPLSVNKAMTQEEPHTLFRHGCDMMIEDANLNLPQISPQSILYGDNSLRIPSPIQYDSANTNSNPFHHLLLAS